MNITKFYIFVPAASGSLLSRSAPVDCH